MFKHTYSIVVLLFFCATEALDKVFQSASLELADRTVIAAPALFHLNMLTIHYLHVSVDYRFKKGFEKGYFSESASVHTASVSCKRHITTDGLPIETD